MSKKETIEQYFVKRGVDPSAVNFSLESIRAAAINAKSVKQMSVAIPTVDPRDIRVDDEIYVIKATPVDDDSKDLDAVLMIGHQAIMVETISSISKPGYITINGQIDLPKEPTTSSRIMDCVFTDEKVCTAVVEVLANFEYERAIEVSKRAQKIAEALEDQIVNERF